MSRTRTSGLHSILDQLTDISELLLERGAEVDRQTEDQETPLDLASGNEVLQVDVC